MAADDTEQWDFKFELPFCMIPRSIRKNYTERVKQFYQQQGKEEIEKYAKDVEKKYGLEFESLIWDNESGLKSICFMGSGLDLEDRFSKYIFHNIPSESSREKAAFELAKKYITLLEQIKVTS